MIDYTEGSGKQYHTGISPDMIGNYVFLPGDPKRCKLIASRFDNPVLVADNREFVTYTGMLYGEKVSVTSTGIGGPSAAIAMEELAECGAHTFIRVGTCGGIKEDAEGGDIAIATSAIRMEGTSKEYAPIEFPAVANFTVTSELISAADRFKLKHHTGIIQCKDAFFGQHRPEIMPTAGELNYKWEAWKKLNVVASEMESAALFVVASYLNVRCGTVLLVVANQEREKLGLSNKQVHDINPTIDVAIEAMRKIMKKDNQNI